MANIDREYHELCRTILRDGYEYIDKSRGIKCKQISSYTLTVNKVFVEFPLITTKKMFTKGIVGELLWFLRGDNNIKYLIDNNINIWNKDAYNYHVKAQGGYFNSDNWYKQLTGTHEYGKDFGFTGELGDVGRNYGVQWRQWTKHKIYYGNSKKSDPKLAKIVIFEDSVHRQPVDQIGNLIKNLKEKPMSRRHIVTAWNPAELDETALPPCHWSFEVIPYPIPQNDRIILFGAYHPGKNLSDFSPKGGMEVQSFSHQIEVRLNNAGVPEYMFDLKWHQRSVDTFLGLPFNITSYALLMRIIGELTNMLPNELIGDLSNVHFYDPHIKLVNQQLDNNPFTYKEVDFEFSSKIKERFQHFRNGQVTLDEILGEIEIKDFEFKDYESYPKIEAEMYEPKK